MSQSNQDNTRKRTIFSKDNPIIEISSKQNQIRSQNITVPVKPKETPKSE